MHNIYFIIFFLVSHLISAQTPNKLPHSLYMVQLTDKKGSPYSVFNPEEYLSRRALERRSTQGIDINEQDLPISPHYLKDIEALGVSIQGKSKWLNALAIHTEDPATLAVIQTLPFVEHVQPLGKFRKAKKGKLYQKRPVIDSSKHKKNYYGLADHQIKMLQGHKLHQLGFEGQDVHIAIVDGGFRNVYRMAVFDSLYQQNRLLGTQDFVDGDNFVYESSVHGTNVLSIMAANQPKLMVGTAPKAFYYLFKTEDVRGEYRSEEFYWITALEHADSLGVDLVNSSMGYHRFRDTSMSYNYADLDGNTTLISQGAKIAVSKGLLIVNAAGNEGHKDWHYLSAPADVTGVLTVAAVDPQQQRANFSAWGPTADGRIKPDIAAQGVRTAYASMIQYNVGYGDGTSYACPVVAGLVANLKQAFPKVKNTALIAAIQQHAHQAQQPDSALGYGIPNFWKTYLSLADASIFIPKTGQPSKPQKVVQNTVHVYVETSDSDALELTLYNIWDKKLYQHQESLPAQRINKVTIPDFKQYGQGVYSLKIKTKQGTQWIKLIQ